MTTQQNNSLRSVFRSVCIFQKSSNEGLNYKCDMQAHSDAQQSNVSLSPQMWLWHCCSTESWPFLFCRASLGNDALNSSFVVPSDVTIEKRLLIKGLESRWMSKTMKKVYFLNFNVPSISSNVTSWHFTLAYCECVQILTPWNNYFVICRTKKQVHSGIVHQVTTRCLFTQVGGFLVTSM